MLKLQPILVLFVFLPKSWLRQELLQRNCLSDYSAGHGCCAALLVESCFWMAWEAWDHCRPLVALVQSPLPPLANALRPLAVWMCWDQ